MRTGRKLSCVALTILLLGLVGCPTEALGGTINAVWNGGTGNWSVPTDWTPNGVPNNGGGNVCNVTIDSNTVTLDVVVAPSRRLLCRYAARDDHGAQSHSWRLSLLVLLSILGVCKR